MTAESHVLQCCSSVEAAEQFLMFIDRFRSWAHRHGASPEGNPSGGNKFRGLYNISIKSLGAAMKRHPDVPLDACVEYGERLATKAGPGVFGFMDSPGNDLESIAGQARYLFGVLYSLLHGRSLQGVMSSSSPLGTDQSQTSLLCLQLRL